MRDKLREKEHKKVRKYIRAINHSISNDAYLGLNRFKVYMFNEDWLKFNDNSGGFLHMTIKMSDNLTGNSAYFYANDFNYKKDIPTYLNDFLISCSCGDHGHFPPLHYMAYDVHKLIPYAGDSEKTKFYDEAVMTYNNTKYNLF